MSPRIRLWNQRELLDCGPTALLNALRWLGYYVSLRHYKNLCEECGYTKKAGTNHYRISQVLKTVAGLKIVRPRKMTIPRFKNFLNGRQTAIIMSYRLKPRGKGHICLVVKQRGQLRFINMYPDELYTRVNDTYLDKLLRSKGRGFPALWFLEKV